MIIYYIAISRKWQKKHCGYFENLKEGRECIKSTE